ncbi:MAG: HAD-superfamily hydrolase, subfamily variant 3 [Candidatus Saccharibacteria bacterium]|jgi:tRNA threonylcarbamoyladenosine biosynthesis protein TsaB|nr:HAD-superfamily hydrolase, subfamily variant 3 [Candidatus Saccharibacteria bacterium]
MILLLDTSTPLCKLTLVDGEQWHIDEWQADRTLAKNLLRYMQGQLRHYDKSFADILGIGVYQGPGSFTGLRIGLTVLNTMADSERVPIVGVQGDDWQRVAIQRLMAGENDKIVLPFYGSEAHITTPRK